MAVYTSEIASSELVSDNPVHQRLFFGYVASEQYAKGDLLEVGCGTGRGIEILVNAADNYTGIDKNEPLIKEHTAKYPQSKFYDQNVPPFTNIPDESMDTVITFHVIEHIKDDNEFVKEIKRVLKPGGTAIVTTPNVEMRLARNPWHVREYTRDGLKGLLEKYFDSVECKGICGSSKMMEYFEENRKSVQKIMKFDILNLQYLLPAFILKMPYDFMNRRNRNKLIENDDSLASSMTVEDFSLDANRADLLDHFMIVKK
jgi:2-polyprenyl-3-methyl-5-hydroxy-6-metoxy-1,4-benzoquinol methylase